MKAPCKDCEKRHPNCHSECEAYQAYDRENKARQQRRLIENDALAVIRSRREKDYFKSLKNKMKGGNTDE